MFSKPGQGFANEMSSRADMQSGIIAQSAFGRWLQNAEAADGMTFATISNAASYVAVMSSGNTGLHDRM
jgi:hypothetical protein